METVVFLVFSGIVATSWKYCVDGLMIYKGTLASAIADPKLLVSDFYPIELMTIFGSMMRVLFWAPLILLLLEIFRKSQLQEVVGGFTRITRVAVTWVAFIIPLFVAVFIPMAIAIDINKNAALTAMNKQILSEVLQQPVAEIFSSLRVNQTFRVYEDNFSALSIQLATYARYNSSYVDLKILDDSGGVVHSERVETREVKDNAWYPIVFEPQGTSKDKKYSLVITPGSKPGSAITAYSSVEDSIPEVTLQVNRVT